MDKNDEIRLQREVCKKFKMTREEWTNFFNSFNNNREFPMGVRTQIIKKAYGLCTICKEIGYNFSHIVPQSLTDSTAPRYDPSKSNNFVKSRVNCIYTCASCSIKIDMKTNFARKTYTAEYLTELKKEHERETSLLFASFHKLYTQFKELGEDNVRILCKNSKYILRILNNEDMSSGDIRDYFINNVNCIHHYNTLTDHISDYNNNCEPQRTKLRIEIQHIEKQLKKNVCSKTAIDHKRSVIDSLKSIEVTISEEREKVVIKLCITEKEQELENIIPDYQAIAFDNEKSSLTVESNRLMTLSRLKEAFMNNYYRFRSLAQETAKTKRIEFCDDIHIKSSELSTFYSSYLDPVIDPPTSEVSICFKLFIYKKRVVP